MKKVLTIFFILTIGISLQSCAFLYNKNPYNIEVHTNPSNANVYLNDSLTGTTPFYKKLDSSISTYKVVIKKEGYTTESFKIEKTLRPTLILGDLLPYGVPLYIELIANQSFYKYYPEYTYINLKKSDDTTYEDITKFKNHIYTDICPFVGFSGGAVNTTIDYRRSIITINSNKSSYTDIGISIGYGIGGTYAAGFSREGTSINSMISISFKSINNPIQYYLGFGTAYIKYHQYEFSDGEFDKKEFVPCMLVSILKYDYFSNFGMVTYGVNIGYMPIAGFLNFSLGYNF